MPITVKDEKEKIDLWKYYQMDRGAPCKYLIPVESDKTIVKIQEKAFKIIFTQTQTIS